MRRLLYISFPLIALWSLTAMSDENINKKIDIIYTSFKNDTKPFQEKVFKLKNFLIKEIKKHETKKLPLNYIHSFLKKYNNFEKINIKKEDNIFFVNTIPPLLFENHDFQTLTTNSEFSKEQCRFLTRVFNNSYLVSHYIYHYQFPLKRYHEKIPF